MSYLKLAEMVGLESSDEKDFDPDKVKEFLDKKFVSRDLADKDPDIVSKIKGAAFGGYTTKVVKMFGLKSSDIKDKKFEEILDLGNAAIEAKLKEAESKIGKSEDERVQKLTTDLNNERIAKTDLEKALEDTKTNSEKALGEVATQLKQVKLGTKLEKAFSGVNFVDEYHKDTLKKEGFNALIAKKYKYDLDENDAIVVLNADGTPVKHPKKTGHFASFEEVLGMEAEANGLLKKNNAETPVKKSFIKTGQGSETVEASKTMKKAYAHLEKVENRGF